tara:strand:- start:353 stop:508 length:156 start_codon:yes stop_codon:yes gene_type:complete
MSTKGSWQRPDGDRKKFDEEYDRIFGKSTKGDAKQTDEQEELGDANDTDDE